jgi:predicted RNA-binding Zn ribbon-like protein
MRMMTRPLIGEPLAVDLLNTRWQAAGRDVDLLATTDGFAQWLAESGQDDLAPTEAARAAACDARAAIQGIVTAETGGADSAGAAETAAESAVNGILARGLTVRAISGGIVEERTIVTSPEWTAAWRAVADYLRLRGLAPGGIRQCRHPDCVLYFFDPTGRRRWCSMAGCGNRAKAKRHYARSAGNRAHGAGPKRDG